MRGTMNNNTIAPFFLFKFFRVRILNLIYHKYFSKTYYDKDLFNILKNIKCPTHPVDYQITHARIFSKPISRWIATFSIERILLPS